MGVLVLYYLDNGNEFIDHQYHQQKQIDSEYRQGKTDCTRHFNLWLAVTLVDLSNLVEKLLYHPHGLIPSLT
jgi:hypothetical protein